LFFIFIMVIEFIYILFFPEFINEENFAIALGVIFLDIAIFIWLKKVKAYFYINSLLHQYKKITINSGF
ncbi:MAG: hypothetical protein V2B14_05900, partial [bacterium]